MPDIRSSITSGQTGLFAKAKKRNACCPGSNRRRRPETRGDGPCIWRSNCPLLVQRSPPAGFACGIRAVWNSSLLPSTRPLVRCAVAFYISEQFAKILCVLAKNDVNTIEVEVAMKAVPMKGKITGKKKIRGFLWAGPGQTWLKKENYFQLEHDSLVTAVFASPSGTFWVRCSGASCQVKLHGAKGQVLATTVLALPHGNPKAAHSKK